MKRAWPAYAIAVALVVSGAACIDFDGAAAAFCESARLTGCGSEVSDAGVVLERVRVTLAVDVVAGDGGGRFVFSDGGRVCATMPCQVTFRPSETLEVRWLDDRFTWLRSLSGCDAGTSTRCRLTADDDGGTVTAVVGQPNVVFVTPHLGLAQLNAQPGANAYERAVSVCNDSAAVSELPDVGSYVPWVGVQSNGVDLRGLDALLDAGARGWVRPDGRPVFDVLLRPNGSPVVPWYAPTLQANGLFQVEGSATRVWSGLDAQLKLKRSADGGSGRCGELDDPAGGIAPWGVTDYTLDARWAWSLEFGSCGDPSAALLCFGSARREALALRFEAPRRLAFVTEGAFRPNLGVAAADALCAEEAERRGLARAAGFVALLSVGSDEPSARLTRGLPWATEDGFDIFPELIRYLDTGQSTPAGTRLLTAIAKRGSQVAQRVWVGAPGFTCADWSSNDSANQATTGFTSSSALNEWYREAYPYRCNDVGFGLYCFER